MNVETIGYSLFFYTFALSAVFLAFCVVLTKRILRSVVYLMGVLLLSSAFYFMLKAQFLGGVQILVYVGGIVILLVYAVMLTQTSQLEEKSYKVRRFLAFLVSSGFFVFSVLCFLHSDLKILPHSKEIILPQANEYILPEANEYNDIQEIARKLLSQDRGGYVIAFEILSFLLLASVIGGIVLARKITPKDDKSC